MNNRIVSILAIYLFLVGCNSETAFDCVKTTGDYKLEHISYKSFKNLIVYDGIEVQLVDTNEPSITVEGGENVIADVQFSFKNDSLIIEDNNTCNWVRKYDPIKVTVATPDLEHLILFGYGNVSSPDTLRYRQLRITTQFSSSDIDLKINNRRFIYVSNSINQTTISGQTEFLQVGQYYNEGLFDGRNFRASNVTVLHSGYYKSLVSPQINLDGYIESSGIVEYYSQPNSIDVDIQQESGQLVDRSN